VSVRERGQNIGRYIRPTTTLIAMVWELGRAVIPSGLIITPFPMNHRTLLILCSVKGPSKRHDILSTG
jgi:hypothetical protein